MGNSVWIAGLLFLLGFLLTIKGGDWFVDAAVWISEVTGIPKMLIGATVVSLCTTLPELLVSSFAVLSGTPDMGVGNALGSIICNTCLILGISMTFLPAAVHRKTFSIKGAYLLVSIALLFVMGLDRHISLIEGFILIVVLVGYIRYSVKSALESRRMNDKPKVMMDKQTVGTNVAKFIFGIVGIILGARLLVDNGTILAKAAGVSDQLVGLTIVALGTSLPELATTISAVVKKEFSLSVGNVIGANILNIVLIISTCTILSPGGLPINLQQAAFFSQPIAQAMVIDLPVVLVVSLLVLLPGMIKGRLYRWQGITALCCYGAYMGYLALSAFAG